MCLEIVTQKIDNPTDEVVRGWKVVFLIGDERRPSYQCGVYAKGQAWQTAVDGPGFHIWAYREAARQDKRTWARPQDFAIYRAEVRRVTRVGAQAIPGADAPNLEMHKVYIGQEMRLLERVR
jgi:hypothetical protein